MPRLARAAVIVAVAAAFMLGAVACSSSSSSPDASRLQGSSRSSGSTITIKNFEFSPSSLKVKVGTTVTVKNSDGTDHTATADNGSFDTGHIAGDKTATFTVKRAGTFPYHCDIHQFMTGVLEVTP